MDISNNDLLQLDSLEILNLVKKDLDDFYYSYENISISFDELKKITLEEIEEIKQIDTFNASFTSELFKRIEKRIKIDEEIYSDQNYRGFLTNIRKYPVLSQEETMELIPKAQSGDQDAMQKLVKHNLKLVLSLAKRFVGLGVRLDDLVQEGTIGLINAIRKFDVSKGTRFSTYAMYWIKNTLYKSVHFESRNIRIPSSQYEALLKYKKTNKELYSELRREPTIEEIANKMKIPYDKCLQLYFLQNDTISLNTTVYSDEGSESEFGDFIESKENVEESVILGFLETDVKNALYDSKLSDRERFVLVHRFALFNNKKLTLDEIGKRLNLTRERVRQLENNALVKIRKSKDRNKLINYLPENAKKSKTIIKDYEEYGDLNKKIPKKIFNYLFECSLTPFEMQIISLFLGLVDQKPKGYVEISKLTGRTVQYLNKTVKNAYSKITDKQLFLDYVESNRREKEGLTTTNSKKSSNKKEEPITDNRNKKVKELEEINKDINCSIRNQNEDLYEIIEKVCNTKVLQELNKYFSLKESIAVLLLNGCLYDCIFPADYISEVLNIPQKQIFEAYKKSIVVFKYISNDDLEKVKELTKK